VVSRLVLVHGFTQTGRSWAPVVRRLEGAGHRADTPDVAADPGGGDLWATARRLADGSGPATWVGYSMGGRLCLHLALARPEVVERLVLVGATAGLDDPSERAARREADGALADSIEADGVDAFLERWLAQPLFAGLPEEEREGAGLQARRGRTAAELASTLRRLGTGAQEPLWERLGRLEMPVLVVTGERDHKFTALGRRLVEGVGANASLAVVPGAGHACHLEQPDAFVDALRAFLSPGGRPGPGPGPGGGPKTGQSTMPAARRAP